MIAEQFNTDLGAQSTTAGYGNWTSFGGGGIIYGVPWLYSGSQLPGQSTTPNAAFPNGINGGVSTHHAGNTVSNFLFTDGHAKSMRPIQTKPAPATSYDSNGHEESNLWDAFRQ